MSVRPLPGQVRLLGRSKILIKKRDFWVLKGGMARDYLSIFPGSPPSVFDRFLLSLSFYPLFCFCWKDTDKIANQTRKPSHRQGSALLTTLNHHPEVYSAIAMLIPKYINCRRLHDVISNFCGAASYFIHNITTRTDHTTLNCTTALVIKSQHYL